jgi:hypothetical protein
LKLINTISEIYKKIDLIFGDSPNELIILKSSVHQEENGIKRKIRIIIIKIKSKIENNER